MTPAEEQRTLAERVTALEALADGALDLSAAPEVRETARARRQQ